MKIRFTQNQKNVILCLAFEFEQLQAICDKYATIQALQGYNPWGYAWKTEVSRCLLSLIAKGVVEKGKRGFYKLKKYNNEE
jgi:hypothetical protein